MKRIICILLILSLISPIFVNGFQKCKPIYAHDKEDKICYIVGMSAIGLFIITKSVTVIHISMIAGAGYGLYKVVKEIKTEER